MEETKKFQVCDEMQQAYISIPLFFHKLGKDYGFPEAPVDHKICS